MIDATVWVSAPRETVNFDTVITYGYMPYVILMKFFNSL